MKLWEWGVLGVLRKTEARASGTQQTPEADPATASQRRILPPRPNGSGTGEVTEWGKKSLGPWRARQKLDTLITSHTKADCRRLGASRCECWGQKP